MTRAVSMTEALRLLERTPSVLLALLDGLDADWLDATEGPDTFSPREVVAHLIQGEEDDWIPRMRIILERGESATFTPFDRFAHREWYADVGITELLHRFAAARAKSLAALRMEDNLEDKLEWRGRHPELGTVTLRQLLSTWVVHDLGHIRQICRVMASQLRSDVGPWEAYLPVLHDREPARR